MNTAHVTADFALNDLSKRASSLDRATSFAPLAVGGIVWLFPILGRVFFREMTRRVVQLHLKAITYRAIVDRIALYQGLIDEDMSISDSLERLKGAMLKIRAAALKITDENKKIHRLSSLHPAILELASAAMECYTTLCDLQEDVEEHDADFASRVDGFTATSQEEFDTLLEKIAVTV